MIGVTINGKHLYDDMGLIMVSKTISEPKVQEKMVSVAGRNGSIDMSEVLTGQPRYQDRTIEIKLRTLAHHSRWSAIASDLANFIHGQKCKIVFDDDKAFYYYGRIEMDKLAVNKSAGDITLKAVVDPYKYSIVTSADRWLWDPFDFEEGVINEACNLRVDGSLDFELIGSPKWETPIVISDSDMELTVTNGADETKVSIEEGSNILYEVLVMDGISNFHFEGNGVVTINYTGGML